MKKNKIGKIEILLIIGIVYMSINFCNLIRQELHLQNYRVRLNQEMNIVEKEQDTLKQNINYYKTQNGMEDAARSLGYIKENEIPIRFIKSE